MTKLFVRRLVVSALQIAITLGSDGRGIASGRLGLASCWRFRLWRCRNPGRHPMAASSSHSGLPAPLAASNVHLLYRVFFTLFTPGLIAGDAVQILYLVKAKPERKAGAVLVVVMDRILGLLALVALAIVVAAARFHWLRRTAVTARLFDLTIILLAVGLLSLIVALPAAKSRRLENLFSALHLAAKIA